MSPPSVVLVAMPWHALGLPSIQLGILARVLERAGIATEVRSLMLAFMEHCRAETAARPDAERIAPADYETVGESGVSRSAWATGSSPSRRSGTPPTSTRDISHICKPGACRNGGRRSSRPGRPRNACRRPVSSAGVIRSA